MSNAVDERIVEAKFDAADFEKGVDKTIKKLDELKKELNIKESGKNITEFAKETSEAADKAGKSLEKLGDRFTTFTGMVKQRILGGFADEVAGIFTNIQHSVTGLIRSLSSDQVGAGLNKYTEILNSVRTMTAAGIAEDTAYEKIKRLAAYSDQTSYSLDQMTNGMSKLVAAGMDVDKAEKSMEGLANMCASAGVNIYEAQRAFLNFSQAYSSGTMRVNDWMSFESLNMATQNIMKIFMEAGDQVGTLVKSVDKAGNEIYKTSNKINKKIKANKEVSTKAFRDTLNFGWLDKATMEQATAVLSYFEDLGVDINKLSDEELKNFATQAFQAAKEAKSFADVIGTVKDVIATGWATTFEHIFGRLDEAKKFFTWLSESNLASILYDISEFRNDVLRTWGEGFEGVDSEGNLINGVFQADKTGRKSLQEALKNIDDLIGSVRKGIADIGPEFENKVVNATLSFPEQLGRQLGILTRKFMWWTDDLLRYYTTIEMIDGEEVRVLKPEFQQRLEKIVTSFNAIFSLVGKIIGAVTQTFNKVVGRIQPVIDAVVDAFAKLMEPFVELDTSSDIFDKFSQGVDNFLTTIQPLLNVLPPIIELLGEVGKFFVSMAIDTFTMNIQLIADAIGFLVELFGGKSAQKLDDGIGVIQGMKNDIIAFGNACKEALGFVGVFFSALFTDLGKLFGIYNEDNTDPNRMDDGLIARIMRLFDPENGFTKSKLATWVSEKAEAIKKWFLELPEKLTEGIRNLKNRATALWEKIDEFLFGKKVKSKDPDTGDVVTRRLKTGFSLLLDKVVKKITAWFKSIPQKIRDLWKTIDEFIFGKEVQSKDPETGDVQTRRIKEGFSKWLDETVTEVKNFFMVTVPNEASKLWKGIMEFFFGKDVIAFEADENGVMQEGTAHVEGAFVTWFNETREEILKWAESLPEKLKGMWNYILSFFFGSDEEVAVQNDNGVWEQKTLTTQEKFQAWLNDTRTTIETWAKTIPDQIAGLWNTIVDFFFGTPTSEYKNIINGENQQLNSSGDRVLTGFSLWLANTITEVEEWSKEIPTKVRGMWNTVLDTIFGTNEKFDQKKYNELWLTNQAKAMEYKKSTEENPVVQAAKENLQTVAEAIGKEILNLPTNIVKGWKFGTDLLGDVLNKATKFFQGKKESRNFVQNTGESAKDLMKKSADEMVKDASAEDSEFVKALAELGSNIGGLIGETIPGFLSEAWGFISAEGANLWSTLSGIFEVNGVTWENINTKAEEIGKNIGSAIESIPGHIRTAAAAVKELLRVKSPLDEVRESLDRQLEKGLINREQYQYALRYAEKQIGKDTGKSGLWEGIKEIGKSLGAAFQDIGPDIINGINTGLTSVSGWFDGLTKKLTEAYERGDKISDILAKDMTDEKTGEKNPVWEAVRNLGQTLFSFITTTIPDFLTAAFQEVSLSLPDIISRIFGGGEEGGGMFGNIFGGDSGGSADQKEAGKKAVEEAAMTFMQGANEELEKTKKDVTEQTGGNKKGFSIFDFFVSRAYGEEAEGGGGSATWDEKERKNLMKKTDLIQEFYKEQIRLRGMVEDTHLTTAQRNAASKDIQFYADQIGELEKLDDVMVDPSLWRKADDAEKGTKSMGGFVEGLLGVFQNLANSDLLAVAAIVVGVGYIMSTIRDTLSLSDEIWYSAEKTKWHAIELALAGCIGIIAWAITLVESGDEQKLQKAEGVLDTLVGYLERIGTVISGIMALVAISNGAEAVGDIFGEKDGLGGFWGVIAELVKFGGVAVGGEAIGRGLKGGLNQLWDSASTAFEDLGAGVESAISFILPAISDLATANSLLDEAFSAVTRTADLLSELKKLVDGDLGKGEGFEENAESIAANFILKSQDFNKLTKLFSSIGTVIHGLGMGLHAFNPDEMNADKLEALSQLVRSESMQHFLQSLVTMINLSIPQGNDSFNVAANTISSVLNLFSSGIADLDDKKIELMDSFFTTLHDITVDEDHKFDSEKIGSLGMTFRKFGGGLKKFFQSLSEVKGLIGETPEDMLKYDQIIGLAIKLTHGLAQAASELGNFGALFNSNDALNRFAESMPTLGEGIVQTFAKIKDGLSTRMTSGSGKSYKSWIDEIPIDRMNAISEAIKSIAQIMSGVGTMMGGTFDSTAVPGFIEEFFSGLKTAMTGENNMYAFGLENGLSLDEGVTQGITTNGEQAKLAAQSLVDSIKAIISGLQDPSLTDIKITITPVIEMPDVGEQFGKMGIKFGSGNMFTFDTSGLTLNAQGANPSNGSGEDYGVLTSAITAAITDGFSSITSGDITAKVDVSGVGVNLNAKALANELVGYIDIMLGRNGFLATRN